MAFEPPLRGVRIVESAGWNAVLAGRLFADGGADVVRLIPMAGDPLGAEPPFLGRSGVSVQTTWYNAGKRLLAADLVSAAGREAVLGVLAGADVLVEDWSPGHAPYTQGELLKANPRLVRVSVTPFGQDGPWAAFGTNDLVQNALSGSASVTGDAGTPPLTGYGNQSYHTVGLYVAISALAGLRLAQSTGHGQWIDLSAYEAVSSCTEQVLMEYFFPTGGSWASPVAPRQGSLHWSGAYAVYPTATWGLMVTAALRLQESLLPWLTERNAAQELADTEKYPDLIAIIQDLPYVMQVLREFVAGKDANATFAEAQSRHLPWGPAWDIETVLQSPQISARGFLRPMTVPEAGVVTVPGPLIRTGGPPVERTPAASVGGEPAWGDRPPPPPSGGPATATAPLAGIRVLDFTHVLAGPFGTRVMGDLGADVIKVGTAARNAGINSHLHPYYVMWNRNKRNINLNMATSRGREIARRLASQSDFVVENFSAGVISRWGLDRAAMAADNERLTVISMGGMGQSGPWRDFVSFAPTIHALTGLTYLTGFPAWPANLGYGFSLTDHLSGLLAAYAAVEALEHTRRTGEGLAVDLSQYELGLGLLAPALIDNLSNGANPEPPGNRHPFGAWAPHGIYRCAGEDRWVALAVRGDGEWNRLCALMRRPEAAYDPLFASHEARVVNQDVLDGLVEDWTRTMDRFAVMATCQDAGIAAGAVQDARDLTSCPQHTHRGFFRVLTSGSWGVYGADRFPAFISGSRPSAAEGVHEVGADTFEVMSGILGFGDAEIAELLADGTLT